MTTSKETAPARLAPSVPDELWVADLTLEGPAREEALRRLHGLLLRASRHRVWRLRAVMPGAGVRELEDLAQEAADEALVAVLRQLGGFEGRSRFTTWAYKFAILEAGVAVRRQAWRHREVKLPDHVDFVDLAASPGDLAEAAQLARALRHAIDTALTPHQRRVTLALVVDDVPIDVLAERLGTNRNALYKTLHDARQRLRAALLAAGHLEPSPDRSAP